MNNITKELQSIITYEEMKKGLDPEFIYGQGTTLFKWFLTPDGQPLERGTIRIVGEYKSLPDAKKVYQKLKKHMHNRGMSKTHNIGIRNIVINNKVVFVLAVLRLTEDDMEIKSKLGNRLKGFTTNNKEA